MENHPPLKRTQTKNGKNMDKQKLNRIVSYLYIYIYKYACIYIYIYVNTLYIYIYISRMVIIRKKWGLNEVFELW